MLALVLTGACVGVRRLSADLRYDRHLLPGFDGYVYLAMAEDPGTFTVGPWGYRILTPALAHVLPAADELQAFTWITLFGLTASGGLLFLFLRRLGHAEVFSLLAVLAFTLSAPVGAAVHNGFLTEPLALAFELLLLLALQAQAAVPVLGLVMVLGELTKEVFVLFLPGVFLALRERLGTKRALSSTAALALLVAAVHVGLRRYWAPYPPLAEASSWGPFSLAQATGRIIAASSDWWAILGATGFPLALVGACLPEGRAFLRRYAYLAALTLALPFAVAADFAPGGARRSAAFLPQDVERLLVYALPFILSLALVALGRLGSWSMGAATPSPASPSTGWRRATWLPATGTAMALLAPLLLLDRYRRFDLRTSRDGPHVIALERESFRFASRLEQGRPVFYELLERRYRPGQDDRRYLERMRWFLVEGFGALAPYGTGPVTLPDRKASFLVPCLTPRDLEVVVTVENDESLTLAGRANGTEVFRGALAPSNANRFVLRVPARTLFRGDNVMTLDLLEASAGSVRLRAVTVRPAAAGSPSEVSPPPTP